ncbi:hypothetical protein HHK36_007052 [Tetracentron sinense]|uniref:Peptidase S49 domain-containing protein n=1 Tax=Tetracentron sinense TaxID=13715 RepID=A0A835DPL9_TETSI|nr:hypothetical protein HHK36_007052 [Tetracentron sinense]
MSKLLYFSNALQRRSFSTYLSTSPFPIHSQNCFRNPFSNRQTILQSFPISNFRWLLSIRDFESVSGTKNEEVSKKDDKPPPPSSSLKTETRSLDDHRGVRKPNGDYPSGEFEFKEISGLKKFFVKLRMLFAFPPERVLKGSVLSMKLGGQISDQLKSRFSIGLSLPQICENLIKAAHDPRISGIYLQIEPLKCGWGKVDEIRRHILNFRKSGKFIVGYVPYCREKEYYLSCACEELYAPPSASFALYGLTVQASFVGGVLEKVGIDPQVQQIGKYKSIGEQLTRKNMSKENCEMLTALLDSIYGNWLDKVSSTKGKRREEIENFINEGVYRVERLKEEGWITDIRYDDEVISLLKKRLGLEEREDLPTIDYWKYSRVRNWTLGLSGGKDKIALIRASGSISRVRSPLSVPSSGIIAEKFIEKIRSVRGEARIKVHQVSFTGISQVSSSPMGGNSRPLLLCWKDLRRLREGEGEVEDRYGQSLLEDELLSAIVESERYKAVIIRIDSPGGDALASDLIWREIKLLAASKPVIASMSDVAASGGYYMAMAAGTIVAENLTLTGSIGVVTGKFNLGKLYEKIGFNKEILSRGKYAELTAAEHRPLRPDEAELFAKTAQHAYQQFRYKAAYSRSMTVDQIEEVAQGRVWTGRDAVSRGLVDAIGGISRAVAIAKQKANIPQDRQVTLVELSRPSPTLPEVISRVENTLVAMDRTLKELQDLSLSDGVQARMDGIMFQRLEGASYSNPLFALLKDYLSSL